MAVAGSADCLVTGDKRGLLGLGLYDGTKIVTEREFLGLHRRLP
jgi:predicted nucleic acid-binding protein